MHFIRSRLNKDNFWNLMFCLGMSTGITLSQYLNEDPVMAGIVLWFTILVVPFTIKHIQDVKFHSSYGFFNCNGKSLTDSMPKVVSIVLFLTIALMVLIGLVIDTSYNKPSDIIVTMILTSFFFLVPTLYFIYKNCPISIMFNKNIIKPMSKEELFQVNAEMRTKPIRISSSNHPNYVGDIKYQSLSFNIHNPYRYRR